MSFPKSKRVVFKENPLGEVICQLRFPPILEIGAADPVDFQKSIRQAYPLYERDESGIEVPNQVRGVLTDMGFEPSLKTVTHKFLNVDSSRLISLAREFVAVTENDYTRWEAFEREVANARAAVEAVYDPPFYSRIGLRYQDVVNKSKLGLGESPWQDLLKPTLVGMLGESSIQDSVEQTQTETVINLDSVNGGHVKMRHRLGLLKEDDGQTTQVYIIDCDFFTAERTDKDDVPQVLAEFNGLAGDLFRWAITKKLHDALQPEDID